MFVVFIDNFKLFELTSTLVKSGIISQDFKSHWNKYTEMI